jgi:hypothetical protein
MKRDMNLVRQLLMVLESAGSANLVTSLGLNVTDQVVQYHLGMLVEAGLARSVGATANGDVSLRLTWQGHELLELTRNAALWDRAKHLVRERTGGLSAAALRAVLTALSLDAVSHVERWQPSAEPRQNGNGHAAMALRAGSNGNGSSVASHTAAVADLPRIFPTRDFLDANSINYVWWGQHVDTVPLYLL